jgi:hypothetical protein
MTNASADRVRWDCLCGHVRLLRWRSSGSSNEFFGTTASVLLYMSGIPLGAVQRLPLVKTE